MAPYWAMRNQVGLLQMALNWSFCLLVLCLQIASAACGFTLGSSMPLHKVFFFFYLLWHLMWLLYLSPPFFFFPLFIGLGGTEEKLCSITSLNNFLHGTKIFPLAETEWKFLSMNCRHKEYPSHIFVVSDLQIFSATPESQLEFT